MFLFSVAKDLVTQNSNCRALARRHTITVCDTDSRGRKVQQKPSIESAICENDQRPEENFVRGHASRRPTRLVSYRKHDNKLHGNGVVSSNQHRVHETDVSRSDSPKMHVNTASRRHSAVFISNHRNSVHEPFYDYRDCVSNSVVNAPRSESPCRHAPRPVSPCQHAGRAQSPVRFLSRSQTFTTNIPQNARNCVRNEPHMVARCDSPQTRQLSRSESFSVIRCESPTRHIRSESPCRRSVSSVHSVRKTACDRQSVPDRCSSPCRKTAMTERPSSPCSRTGGNRSRSQSPCRRRSQAENVPVSNNVHSGNKAVPVLRHSRSILKKPSKSVSDIDDVYNEVSRKQISQTSLSNRNSDVPAKNHNSQRQLNVIARKSEINSNKVVSSDKDTNDLSLQEDHSEHVQKEQEVSSLQEKKSHRPRIGIIRARSKPELLPSDLKVKSDDFDSKYKNNIEKTRERPASELDFRRPQTSRIPRALSMRSTSERHLVSVSDKTKSNIVERTALDKTNIETNKETATKTLDTRTDAANVKENLRSIKDRVEATIASRRNAKSNPKEDEHWGLIESKPKRDVKLSRQSAIRTERRDVQVSQNEKSDNKTNEESNGSNDSVSRRLRDVSQTNNQEKSLGRGSTEFKEKDANTNTTRVVRARQPRVTFNETESKQSNSDSDNSSATEKPVRPIRTIIRSKSEVRQRLEDNEVPRPSPETEIRSRPQLRSRSENRPVKGLHYLDKSDLAEKSNDTNEVFKDRLSPVPSLSDEKLLDDSVGEPNSSTFSGLSSAIKGLSKLNVTELLHVSWKSNPECSQPETNKSSPTTDSQPIIPVSILTLQH